MAQLVASSLDLSILINPSHSYCSPFWLLVARMANAKWEANANAACEIIQDIYTVVAGKTCRL